MSTLLLIEDREELRVSITDLLTRKLASAKGWTVLPIFPLEHLDDYPSFLAEHNISVIIADENLREKVNPETQEAVTYSGHEIAKYLQNKQIGVSIFIVTSINAIDDIEDQGQVDYIIPRREFLGAPDVHMQRLIRAGTKYLTSREAELSELARLSSKAATSSLDAAEKIRLDALRQVFGEQVVGNTSMLSDVLSNAERLANEVSQILQELKAKKSTGNPIGRAES
jgi:hypothetical protein